MRTLRFRRLGRACRLCLVLGRLVQRQRRFHRARLDQRQRLRLHRSQRQSGGGKCPDKNFQYHHQAFNYYANYAPGTRGRADHLRDEAEFIQAAQAGTLKAVSFVKPLGEENEHPGYASEADGSSHLVDLVRTIVHGPNGRDTLIIVKPRRRQFLRGLFSRVVRRRFR